MTTTTSPYIPGTKILDDYLRNLEPEDGAMGFSQASVRGVDETERTAEFVISSGEVDRYGEIVDPKAFDKETIAAFMQNPVMLAGHQHSGWSGETTVIGTWLDIKRDGNQVVGVCRFDTDDLGEKYWGKVRRGVMKACSIGFIVRAWRMDEVGTGENKRSVRVFTKIELIEVSIVAVPANRQALLKAAGFGEAGHKYQANRNDASGIDENSIFKKITDHIDQRLSDPDGPVARMLQRAADHGDHLDYFENAATPEEKNNDEFKKGLESLLDD